MSTPPLATPAATDAGPRPSWRRRHPVAARLALYGVLTCVLLAVALLWLRARRAYLEARLESLPLTVQVDPSGAALEAGLDAEYGEWGPLPNPALTDLLRQRVARLRGVVAALRRDRPALEAAFDRAEALVGEGPGAEAAALERAQGRLALGDATGARQALAGRPAPGTPALALWRTLLAAQAAAGAEEAPARRLELEARLGELARAGPVGGTAWFVLRPWTVAEVAVEATRWLLGPTPAAPTAAARSAWRRLLALGAGEAGVLLDAAEGLLGAGDRDGALEAYQRANALDPRRVSAERAARPALRGLDAP